MASTYSPNLKIELIGTGDQSGNWGNTTNNNLGVALEQAIAGKADVTVNSTSVSLTLSDSNAAQDARAIYLNLTGTPGAAATVEVPAIQKPYLVKNGTTGGFDVTVKVSGQTGVTIPNGQTMLVYNNGTDVVDAATCFRGMLQAYTEKVTTATVSTSTYNLDLSLSNIFDITLGANVTFTFTNPPSSGQLKSATVILRQDGTGSRTAAFTNANYTDGTAPVLSTGASEIDVLTFFTVNGGSFWFGTFAMANVS